MRRKCNVETPLLLCSVFWSAFRWRQSGGLVWSGECKLLVRQLWWPGQQLGSSSHITAVMTAGSEVDTVPAGMSVWPLDCNDITPLSLSLLVNTDTVTRVTGDWRSALTSDGLGRAVLPDDGHQTRTRSELTFTRWRHNSTIRWIIGWNDES